LFQTFELLPVFLGRQIQRYWRQTPKAADRDIGMVLLILRAPSVPGLLEGLIAMAMMTAITSGAHSIEPGRSLRAQKLQIASLHLRASEMRAIRPL
jgi:hypothetical protein